MVKRKDKVMAKKSVKEEHKAIKDYGKREKESKSKTLKHQFKRIIKDEKEHAKAFKKAVK